MKDEDIDVEVLRKIGVLIFPASKKVTNLIAAKVTRQLEAVNVTVEHMDKFSAVWFEINDFWPDVYTLQSPVFNGFIIRTFDLPEYINKFEDVERALLYDLTFGKELNVKDDSTNDITDIIHKHHDR